MKDRTLSRQKFDKEVHPPMADASLISKYGKSVIGVKSDYIMLNEPPYTRPVHTVV